MILGHFYLGPNQETFSDGVLIELMKLNALSIHTILNCQDLE